MTYIFKPYHILILAIAIFIIWIFTTGWDCGFTGICKTDNLNVGQGFARVIVLGFLIIAAIVWLIVGGYEKEIYIPNPFKNKRDEENEKLFQEWLLERKKENELK
jgi:hypothetical protein